MADIVWTGKPFKVMLNGTPPGRWSRDIREGGIDVLAMMHDGGTTRVLVADEEGAIQVLSPENYKVVQDTRPQRHGS